MEGTTLQSFWASISFVLGVAITQPIYVSVSDVLGRKMPLYASMLLFAMGAIIFATAKSMGVMIAGRLIQGLGAGGLDVLEEIILADITSLKERPLYIGLIGVSISIGSITGPIIGALFSEFVDWRWIGWINLPIVGSTFVLTFFFLNLRPIEMTFGTKLRRLDWIGMLLFAVGATAVALPLSWASALYPWSSWKTILPLTIGLVVLFIFGLYERKPVEAIIPYRIFSNVTAISSLITAFIHGLILYTSLLYLPLFFQAIFLETPLKAAETMLPICCLVVAFSVISPVTIELTRRYRLLLCLGWILTTLFLGLWCLVGKNSSRAEAYTFQVMLGIGIGIVFTGVQVPMQASVTNVDDAGLAVGMLVIFRLFGALIGLAIGSSVFNSVFQKNISALGTLPEQVKILGDASQAISFIPMLRTLDLSDEIMESIVEVYWKPFRAIWIVLTCLSGIGCFTSWFIEDLTLEKDEVGRQGFVQTS